MAMFMIRYGEIALKSPRVRNRFERALGGNIAARFVSAGKECRIEHDRGRIFLWANDTAFTEWVLTRTFGIVSFSKVEETSSVREDIFRLAVAMAEPHFRKGVRFCIRTRRSGQHGYTSMELARDAGSAVFLAYEHLEPKVDLTNPELEIFIDVRHNKAYIYTGSTPGPGGMPLGTQGRIVGIVERETDAAACWLLMKRGCRVIVATGDEKLAVPLRAWDPDLKIHAPEGGIGPEAVARKRRAEGICLGWAVEDFDRRAGEIEGFEMPVFFPLMGMGAGEVRELMARIRG